MVFFEVFFLQVFFSLLVSSGITAGGVCYCLVCKGVSYYSVPFPQLVRAVVHLGGNVFIKGFNVTKVVGGVGGIKARVGLIAVTSRQGEACISSFVLEFVLCVLLLNKLIWKWCQKLLCTTGTILLHVVECLPWGNGASGRMTPGASLPRGGMIYDYLNIDGG